MKIAIVGAGVSGLGAAYALSNAGGHELTLFESDTRLGGHASTVDVTHYGEPIAVDTGFIIYNRTTYPNLLRLFRDLGVRGAPTHMGFSVSLDNGRFEWATSNLVKIFAQPENALSPRFYALLLEVLRFFRAAKADIAAGSIGAVSLRAYLKRHGFGADIVDRFLVPMGGSIWSASAQQFLDYPAEVLLTFMLNHQLLSVKQPVWLTVPNGSRTYVEKLTATLKATIHMSTAITRVEKTDDGVALTDAMGARALFDHAILACHAPQALAMLAQPTQAERELLGAMKYAKNPTFLHGDTSFMPKRRAAWSSWNYAGSTKPEDAGAAAAITYWMNSLQHIDERYPLFVSLNPPRPPREDLVFAKFDYEHPQFDRAAINAQKQLSTIQGKDNVWFCGAYAGYGFHEDGLRSGLEIAAALSKSEAVPLLGHPRIFA